jgi:hypothetical protein
VTGWTLEYIGAMEFPDALELMSYWAEYPPEHLLLKGYVGYKGPRGGKVKTANGGQDGTERKGKELEYGKKDWDSFPSYVREAIEKRRTGELKSAGTLK